MINEVISKLNEALELLLLTHVNYCFLYFNFSFCGLLVGWFCFTAYETFLGNLTPNQFILIKDSNNSIYYKYRFLFTHNSMSKKQFDFKPFSLV